MNTIGLARLLGWVSLGLGAVEVAAPGAVARNLGLGGGPLLVRGFGLRELGAGFAILGAPESPVGPWARVAGDAMDVAALGAALGAHNPRRRSAAAALAVVVAVTGVDILCAAALTWRNARALRTARRTHVGPAGA